MAENEAASGGSVKSWFKMGLGTIGGLLSGVVVMYFNAAFNQVVKPAKPVPNFTFETQGLTVRFHNLSTSGQGWWDFGDGSPLDPVVPKKDLVEHTYPRPGDYHAKLSLRNLLGEEAERSVRVRIEPPPVPEPPRISNLEAVPVSPGSYAPATFRLVTKVANAQLCVWDLGDERPLDIVTELGQGLDRLVTYQKPGGYVVRLAAISGRQHDEKTEIVTVMEPPANTVTAVLTVTDTGTHVDTLQQTFTFSEMFRPETREDTQPFVRLAAARPGFTLADVRPFVSGPENRLGDRAEMPLDAAALGLSSVRNLLLKMAPDRETVQLTGELFREASSGQAPKPQPTFALPVVLIEQRRRPDTRSPIPVATTLATPSRGSPSSGLLQMPPLPADWVDPQRRIRLELRDGDKVLWQNSDLPRGGVIIPIGSKRFLLTATQMKDQVRIDLTHAAAGAAPLAN